MQDKIARSNKGLPRSTSREAGQAAVETVLISLVLLLLFAGAADIGRMFYSYIVITNAAREGVRTAVRQACDSLTAAEAIGGIQDAVARETSSLPSSSLGDVSIEITPAPTSGCFGSGVPVQVTVSYDFTNLFTGITGLGSTIEMSNFAIMVASGSELAEEK